MKPGLFQLNNEKIALNGANGTVQLKNHDNKSRSAIFPGGVDFFNKDEKVIIQFNANNISGADKNENT